MSKKQNKKGNSSKISATKRSKKELEFTVKTLEEKLEKEQQNSHNYLIRLKYLQADFDNYRKRMEKEVQESVRKSTEKMVSCLLNILDDLESAISAGETTENKDVLLDGIKMVYKNLYKLLENEGLERLECVGQPFDPNLHEILTQVPLNEHETGTILEETRKGFMFKGKVLRPGLVKIACKAS